MHEVGQEHKTSQQNGWILFIKLFLKMQDQPTRSSTHHMLGSKIEPKLQDCVLITAPKSYIKSTSVLQIFLLFAW
jgi:hypothetical protein